jgi:hypothetical protein
MSQWGKNDAASNSVNYAAEGFKAGSGKVAIAANNTAMYNNTTPSAFVPNMAVGQFGISPAEIANTSSDFNKATHAGWNLARIGTGPVKTLTITAGGTGYSNTDKIIVSGGTTNAAFTLTTNSTGGIISTVPTNTGAGFVNTTSVAVANSSGGASAGSNAAFTVNLGGRAGRVSYETLVAMGTIS